MNNLKMKNKMAGQKKPAIFIELIISGLIARILVQFCTSIQIDFGLRNRPQILMILNGQTWRGCYNCAIAFEYLAVFFCPFNH